MRSITDSLIGILCVLGLASCTQHSAVNPEKKESTMEIRCLGPDIPPYPMYYISGLIAYPLRDGDGKDKPGPNDSILASVVERTDKDSAFKSGVPKGYDVAQLPALIAEAFQLMVPGQRLRAWTPHDTDDRDTLAPASPSHLVHDLELHAITLQWPRSSIPTELQSPSK